MKQGDLVRFNPRDVHPPGIKRWNDKYLHTNELAIILKINRNRNIQPNMSVNDTPTMAYIFHAQKGIFLIWTAFLKHEYDE